MHPFFLLACTSFAEAKLWRGVCRDYQPTLVFRHVRLGSGVRVGGY